MTLTKQCEPQPRVAYPGTFRIAYETHPFSPSCFRGTPAEGRVPGEDRKGWVAEDFWGNPVGVEEAGWLVCPYLPGTTLPEGTVSGVALVWTVDQWQWAVDIAS